MPASNQIPVSLPVIPTLLETGKDGLQVVAYCPVCDKSERSKVDYPGQPRSSVASVARIRAHWEKRHGRKVPARSRPPKPTG